MIKNLHQMHCKKAIKGQGVVEYAGALIIAVLLIAVMIINEDVYANMFETVLNSVSTQVTSLL